MAVAAHQGRADLGTSCCADVTTQGLKAAVLPSGPTIPTQTGLPMSPSDTCKLFQQYFCIPANFLLHRSNTVVTEQHLVVKLLHYKVLLYVCYFCFHIKNHQVAINP